MRWDHYWSPKWTQKKEKISLTQINTDGCISNSVLSSKYFTLKNKALQVVILDESLKTQDKISSTISHDLKSPLGALTQLFNISKRQNDAKEESGLGC